MSTYLVKTPNILQNSFPNFTWRVPTSKKIIYLTFDDGPTPDITPWVLDLLAKYQAKATFFAIGEQILENSEVFARITEEGHSVGNHTHSHLNGWSVDSIPYFHNVRHCAKLVKSSLFRPPFGQLTPSQAQFLQRHYRVIMWDVMSGDFDPNITNEQCFDNVTNNAKPGSIVVFHDSEKAKHKLEIVLPKVLAHFQELGYQFDALNDKVLTSPGSFGIASSKRRYVMRVN